MKGIAAFCAGIVFLMLVSPAMEQEVSQLNIIIDLQPDLTVRQTMHYLFRTTQQDGLNYSVSGTLKEVAAAASVPPAREPLPEKSVVEDSGKVVLLPLPAFLPLPPAAAVVETLHQCISKL